MTTDKSDMIAGRSTGINAWRMVAWSIAAMILLLPLAAMQVTDEVNWSASDFVFAAVLIGGVGLALELVVRNTRNRAMRAATGLLLAGLFLLIWINAAVGIIGDEDNPLNLLYAGVVSVVVGGAIVTRFRARAMRRDGRRGDRAGGGRPCRYRRRRQ